ncbi:M3 family metallopeptidase [Corynebacterium breve]|uniref:M3 family metallopeptidase n=1 Tax=Corynebacterium breve TaxID=3049799 RepID=A0ABY8VED2_9CORY|nr:M3 family metallopeptidase [Corynebacterium breve]WIM67105.1 M3 family metallopeptidase [Corynebacterium breve]
MSTNPLLSPSELPYQLPDFRSISLAHVEQALPVALKRHNEEVAHILNEPVATWSNTVEALELAGADLERVTAWFFNLQGTDATEEFDRVADWMVPQLSNHADAIYQNAELYRRILQVEVPSDEESQRLHDKLVRAFQRRGADLDEAGKTRLSEINQRLSELSEKFGRNLLSDTTKLAVRFDSADDLAGLSDERIAAALDAEKGDYVIPIELPTTQSAQSQLESQESRHKLFDASRSRGKESNRDIVLESVRLRQERAKLLGYKTHADFVIAEETAGDAQSARDLIADLAPAAAANAEAERKLAAELAGYDLDGADWPYWQAQRAERELNVNEAELRKYFPLDQVLRDGVFYAAHKLYGIVVEKRDDLSGYRDDVDVWEVIDHDGAGLGLLLTDYRARPSKRGGAWMSSFVDQSRLAGTKPVVVNVMSVTDNLLSIDDVTTVFHEFGHALHGLLSDVRYPTLSGTSVPRDWVEFPSQINENYAFAPEIVRNYARHVDTGEVIPDSLMEAVVASRQFGQGFATAEYLAASAIDLAWHSLDDEIPTDIDAFEAESLRQLGLDIDGLEPRYRSTWFNHIFAGGYSAGYYSYLWAEALDADGYRLVEERGINRETGQLFRDTILSRGAASDYAEAYRAFRGRDKDVQPLLERRGLAGVDI